jgi:hypothetical protein
MRVEKTATKSGKTVGETKAERRKIKKLKGYEVFQLCFNLQQQKTEKIRKTVKKIEGN